MKKITSTLIIILLLFNFLSCQEKPVSNHTTVDPNVSTPPILDFIIGDSISRIDLEKISKNSPPLKHGFGKGEKFKEQEFTRYQQLKSNQHCYWAIKNCSKDKIISESPNSKQLVFGASVPKIILATAAIHNNNGRLKNENQWRQLLQLLVVSANDPQWSNVQQMAGGSDSIINFCKKFQYDMRPEKKPGCNMVSANSMVNFYSDLCNKKFKGSDVILKVSNACATSSARSKVYIPDSVVMGGKTGTWSNYIHDTGWLWYNDQYWSIAVLTDNWLSSNDIAILWGGLFKEYVIGEIKSQESSKKDSVDTSKVITPKKRTHSSQKKKKKYKKKRKSKKTKK